MLSLDDLSLGFLFVAIGLCFFLAVWLMLRVATHFRPRVQPVSPASEDLLSDHTDAVVVVESGGRVHSVNPRARHLFHMLDSETPNIERLARKVRPNDALLKLCAAEGQARFVLEGRLVEGTSYHLSHNGSPSSVLVALRYPELTAGRTTGQASLSAQTLQTFTQLTQEMASSLDLEETLYSVLSNIEKLMPADFMEVTIWDEESETFTPYRFAGVPGVDRKLEQSRERYLLHNSISGRFFRDRTPVLISTVETDPQIKAAVERLALPLRSYLGVPLLVSNEFIGTLELGSFTSESFHPEDLDLVRLLSGQAAVALHNALLYQEEQRRTAELSGLAQLTQAFSSVRDPSVLFARLVESIQSLVAVDIIGFLIYNEFQRVLEGRIPFHGLPDPFVELYHTKIAFGSPAEHLLLNQDVLITENASEDEQWTTFELDHLAQAASLRETALFPLNSAGHMLGYLQASNHKGGSISFTQSELHLLTIVANQTASIIENASLVQQSRQRAQRAEALRRLASLASSAATLDEILQYSLQELTRLLRAELAVAFLMDQDRGLFELHRASVVSSSQEIPERLSHLLLDNPQFPFTVAGSQHALTVGHLSDGSQPIIPFYQTLIDRWQIESLVAVPLVMRDEGIGELWFGSQTADFFDQGDFQIVSTAAGQLAGVVEQSFLRSQTDESLRRRIEQMTAINRIGRELSTSLDLNYLLQLVYTEALRTTGADCGTILLFNLEVVPEDDLPQVRFYMGDDPGSVMSAMIRLVLERDASQVVADFSRSDFAPPHDEVQSALVVPITYQQRHAGMICLHGKTPNQFDETALEITQTLAVQAAIALNNALAYEEQTRRGTLLKRELETVSRLTRVLHSFRPSHSLQQSLTNIALAVQSVTSFQVVVISAYDPAASVLRRVVGMGLTAEQWEELQSRTQPWQSLQQLFQPQYQVGQAYYIPENNTPTIPADVHVVSVMPSMEEDTEDAWHAQDLLLIPLYDSSQEPLGLISVDAPRDHRRPDRTTYEALELFAAQAGLALEGDIRFSSFENRITALEEEKARLSLVVQQAQSNLPVLLHKELDQSLALHSLSQRIERVRASLEVAAQANRQESQETILRTLSSEMLTRFAMQLALVAERTPSGISLTEVIGTLPPGANPEALFGQRNPLRAMFHSSSPEQALILVSSLENAPDWQNNTLLNVLESRSMIGLRFDVSADQSVAVLVTGQRTLPAFLEEDRRVFAQLAHQVTVGLQNVQLLTETRRRLREVNLLLDFSRKLGSLEPHDILTSLVESVAQVLPNANAGWVGMWEEKELAIVPQAAVGYASHKDILGICYALQSATGEVMNTRIILTLRVFRTGHSERVAEINFATQYHLGADDLLRYRRATNGRLPLSALLVPLRIGENVLGVLCLENFETQAAFTEEDEALAYSFTRQAAMALENARLYQASEQRATQLQALTKVAGTITSSLQSEELIALLLDQLKIVVPYETATLWLRQGPRLTVAAATGFADSEQRLDLSVEVEDSQLFKTMLQSTQPVSVGDIRNDPRFPMLVEPENLSWVGIPLIYKSELMGLIALEKRESDFYTDEIIQAATMFAGQAAVSLENARLYEESKRRAAELDERSQRLALLNHLSADLVASLDVDRIFKMTGQQLLGALNASGVAAVTLDSNSQPVMQVEVPDQNTVLPFILPPSPLFERIRESFGIFLTDDVASEVDLSQPFKDFLAARQVCSLLVVPLISGSALQGWFLVYSSQRYRYSSSEIELARTISNQVAIAVQNARLFAETLSLTEDLERRVEDRTHELRREHQNSQTLLHIITELSTSLDMGLVLNRTLAVLNESIGAEESFILLSQGGPTLYRAGMHLSSPQVKDKNVSFERQLGRSTIRSRQPVIAASVQDDPRWEIPAGEELAYQSVMAVPLIMGEEVLGAMLLLHRRADFFRQDQINLMEATARQIGIAINNAELFNLIRDQSEHLGSMLREQQIEASRSRAILEAVADGVLVTDPQGCINLFNASAERILELPTDQVMGKTLDQLTGMFGQAANEWTETIHQWSQDPLVHQDTESYAKQFDLNNGRVVAVHLAPVFWRQEFLGTVSIFRDITHEVQVDRLKSEFVANVSHELRTPMTSIKGYVEIMLMGAAGELSPQQVHFLKIVKSNTERLSVLVNDLLDVSRIEAGRVTLNLQGLNLLEVAEDVVTDLKRRSREENKPMRFALEIPADLPSVCGDLERVRQVLSSLISNGYNYTPEDGLVTVRMTSLGREVRIDVIDNGIGIAVDEQHRIFERFYRGEDPLVLATAGTGLGLAISRTLIEMHHGRIWFSSDGIRGEGSVFSFTLPVYEEKEE